MTKDLNKINPGPFGSTVTNFAVIEKTGANFNCAGVRDFMDENPIGVDGDTMFGEGSIGKVRFAGLAYMLQQEGIIGLKDNAGEFFASEKFGKFLIRKYPDKAVELQAAIVGFFSSNKTDPKSFSMATLADLTTHYSGVGDLTRDHGRLIADKGVEYECTIPELILPGLHSNLELRIGNKLRAHGPGSTADKDLPAGEYGQHQYSNLGYMLLGLAMEAAYEDKHPDPDKQPKDYRQLMRDFILHPGKVEFSDTRFPEDIGAKDNAVRANWVENGRLVNANKVSSANAAGGMFASANDSTKFFEEFFAGFPGTEKNGKDPNNKFFKPETIELMRQEWIEHHPANLNEINDIKREGKMPQRIRFQGPGFCVDYPYDPNYFDDQGSFYKKDFFAKYSPSNYDKGGETFGYKSMMKFNPQTGDASIAVVAQENLTDAVAKKLDVKTTSVIGCYSKSELGFDRYKMLKIQAPELLEQREIQRKAERSFVEKTQSESKGATTMRHDK
jgi:CubicO group peptidase (beta-lactamase class C family)